MWSCGGVKKSQNLADITSGSFLMNIMIYGDKCNKESREQE